MCEIVCVCVRVLTAAQTIGHLWPPDNRGAILFPFSWQFVRQPIKRRPGYEFNSEETHVSCASKASDLSIRFYIPSTRCTVN